MAIDDCIRDGIMVDLLTKERDRVENILIRGLTEEEKEQLHEIQLKRALAEGSNKARLEAVDRIVAAELSDAEKACEILGVSIEDYNRYIADRK